MPTHSEVIEGLYQRLEAARTEIAELQREKQELLELLHSHGNRAQSQVLALLRENQRLQRLVTDAAAEAEGLTSGYVAPAREKKLPTLEELAGSDPDFTGGLESVEYLRQLRGEGPAGAQEAEEEASGREPHSSRDPAPGSEAHPRPGPADPPPL